ncbi:response regulator [Leadbetterella sp. DM7]|uniref:response regulator transcription factor n=1 Tax=Leadbetterella sp. DM7 TaxID=3235085 RepID=UPI00349EC5F3
MKTKVVIVDDHELIAKAIGSIVNDFESFEVIYDVGNGAELKEKFKLPENRPSIVLLDISMPVMDGFQTARWLKKYYPDVLVMALSMQDDEQSLFRMINNGAKGFMHKNIHPHELEFALKTLLREKIYFPGWATEKLYSNVNTPQPANPLNPYNITAREEEFLKYVCQDLTYKEIAVKMACSHRTVDGYRDSLFTKLGTSSRVGLVLFAVKYKYFDPKDFKL